jgi:hypothetical protein
MNIPGALTAWNDAALLIPEMDMLLDAPAVKVTPTLTNCGSVFTDWNTSVAV